MGNVGIQGGFNAIQFFKPVRFLFFGCQLCFEQPSTTLKQVDASEEEQYGDTVEGISPPGPPPGRQDGDLQGAPFFVPDAVRVSSFDMEGILSGIEVGVGGRSLSTHVLPVLLKSIQVVRILDACRIGKVQTGIGQRNDIEVVG